MSDSTRKVKLIKYYGTLAFETWRVFSRLIVIAHIKNRNHGLCILYRMFSLQPQIRSLSLKKSLVKPLENNICRNEAIMKLSELSSYLAYISFSYSKYPSISKLFKYFPRKPSVSQNLPMEKNICRSEAIIKLSELSSHLAYISFSYSKYPSISKLFKYFPRKPSVSQNLPMEKNICRSEAIIKLSELSSHLAYISFSYSKYPSISKVFKYFPRKPSVSQNLPMEKNICRSEAVIKLSELSSHLAYISFSYSKYPSISKVFKYFPRKPSVSQNLPMEKNICRSEAIIKLSELSSHLAYISFSYSKYPSISKVFKYFPRKPSVSQNLPMEKNICRSEAIIKLSELSSHLAYISFSYSKYPSISKVFKYFPRKPSVSQNLPMEKNICRSEAIIKLSELSSHLAYISFSYSKYPSISKVFKYFPRKPSVSQNLPMEKNICRSEAIIKLSELSSHLAYISFSYSKYPSISKVFKYFPRKPSVSQNLPMEKNICRSEAIIKLSELSSHLAYISFSYSKYPSISKLFKYFPRKPSVSQNLPLLSIAASLQKGALSNDLNGVVAKIFPGANPRTPIFARFARIWYQHPEHEFRPYWSDH